MHDIQFKVQAYLDGINAGTASMPSHIIDEAAQAFRFALKRQFNPRPGPRPFTLRMSNVGRPLCQLLYEKRGTQREPESYNHPVKMMLGDASEAIMIAILRAAGVDVTATAEKAKLALEVGGEIEEVFGTTDVTIDSGSGDEIWDVKSASGYAFREKFATHYGIERLLKDDPFGYIGQGMGYEEGTGKRFAGWIAVSKESGEIALLEVPKNAAEQLKPTAMENIRGTVAAVKSDDTATAPIDRCFNDEAETYRKKPTGNRVLGMTCSYCPYKWTCWPGLRLEKQRASVAQSPKMVYYTHIADHDSASEESPQ